MTAVPDGTIISFATAPDSLASDGGPGAKDSPYALALNDVMHTPGIDVLQAFNQVGVTVQHATADQQRPWLSSSPIDGEYYFSGAPAPPPPPPAATQTVASLTVPREIIPPAGTATSLHCPAAGTTAVRGGREIVKYAGPDPQDASICFFQIGNNWNKMAFGLWSSRVEGAAKFADAVQNVIKSAPGNKTTFEITTTQDSVKRLFENEVIFEDVENLRVEQVDRPAFRITLKQREEGGNRFDAEWQLWFDQATGVMLRYNYTVSGHPDPRHPDWVVTQLRVPG